MKKLLILLLACIAFISFSFSLKADNHEQNTLVSTKNLDGYIKFNN